MISGTGPQASTRSGRRRGREVGLPGSSGQVTKRFRGKVAACGRRVHEGTNGWPDQCGTCPGGVSHRGSRLCSACHQGPSRNDEGHELWKHIAQNDQPAGLRAWDNVALSRRHDLLARADYSPATDCLCAMPGGASTLSSASTRSRPSAKVSGVVLLVAPGTHPCGGNLLCTTKTYEFFSGAGQALRNKEILFAKRSAADDGQRHVQCVYDVHAGPPRGCL